MPTTFFQIVGRFKQNEMFYGAPADFTGGNPEPVSPRRVLDEPGWSPYCLAAASNEIVFVRLPPHIDLAEVPFHFVTQFREANAMLVMQLDEVPALSASLSDPRLIFIFSIGRCGTTLVSHALNGSPEVSSLSEPEIFNHRQIRELGDRAPGLIGDFCRLLFATRVNRDAGTLAIKFRSQALFIADRFFAARLDASYVFMYRDAISWSESLTQFMINLDMTMPLDAAVRDFNWAMISADLPTEAMGRYLDLDVLPVDPGLAVPAGWLVQLEEYLKLLEGGMPFLALRYNDLVADRARELGRLFHHCGVSEDAIPKALTAFDEDSQKGTAIGRGKRRYTFDDAAVTNARRTLARVPRLANPDLRLPDIHQR
jgi:hypothetical protein